MTSHSSLSVSQGFNETSPALPIAVPCLTFASLRCRFATFCMLYHYSEKGTDKLFPFASGTVEKQSDASVTTVKLTLTAVSGCLPGEWSILNESNYALCYREGFSSRLVATSRPDCFDNLPTNQSQNSSSAAHVPASVKLSVKLSIKVSAQASVQTSLKTSVMTSAMTSLKKPRKMTVSFVIPSGGRPN